MTADAGRVGEEGRHRGCRRSGGRRSDRYAWPCDRRGDGGRGGDGAVRGARGAAANETSLVSSPSEGGGSGRLEGLGFDGNLHAGGGGERELGGDGAAVEVLERHRRDSLLLRHGRSRRGGRGAGRRREMIVGCH